MTKTKIEWADRVWNPVTGCTKVSEGCRYCYAETMAKRFWGDRKFSEVECHKGRLEQPLKWMKPCKIFVNSMSDLFHEYVSDRFIRYVFEIMSLVRRHTFIVLTKRPERMMEFMNGNHEFVQSHIWLGVSVEDQKTADERIPLLLQTSAVVRFVSCEPLLGGIDLQRAAWLNNPERDRLPPNAVGLDWVIVGGESGVNARPMHPDWVRSIRDQCLDAAVPFFFKQWGEYRPTIQKESEEYKGVLVEKTKECGYYCDVAVGHVDHGSVPMIRDGRKAAGRILDGREWNEFPDVG